ncbi:MAG: AAA family ATPase [Planctomycetaceae bacterium]|nr:AAA family ATPase [Planctomycetaceae bacterium]
MAPGPPVRGQAMATSEERGDASHESPQPRAAGSAHGPPGADGGWESLASRPPFYAAARRPAAHSLCVASGKGGVGKTAVAASLAQLFARLGSTLIVDGDLGVGNAHILQDVQPERHLGDVVCGRVSLRDALVSCEPHLDLVCGGSGLPHLAHLEPSERRLLALGLADVQRDYRAMLVDCGAGVSDQTLDFAEGSDGTLLVTTPDVTALTDAYAFYKVLLARQPDALVWLVVNRAQDAAEAQRVLERFEHVSRRFLGASPKGIGWIPDDPAVRAAVNRRRAVVRAEPTSPSSRALAELFARLVRELSAREPAGLGTRLSELSTRPRRLGA